ncbi:hypothetical protein DYH10_02175 [Candidatus Saccharibacteria bacterium CPR2]|nr:hypothetical protein [Candidatus Saccharibacteria bacterium CPR2]
MKWGIFKSKSFVLASVVACVFLGIIFALLSKDGNAPKNTVINNSSDVEQVKSAENKLKVVEASGEPTSVIDYLQGTKPLQSQPDKNYQVTSVADQLQPNAGRDSFPSTN